VRKYASLLDLMRDAPLVAIPARGGSRGHATLWAQLELALPGAMKDRPSLEIVEQAEAAGLLRPGGTIIESSSGTMAEGLARVGLAKGYRVIIVTDPRIDELTAAKLRALGAEIEIVDTFDVEGGWQRSRLRRLREVQESMPEAFWTCQYDNPANAGAYERLAEELAEGLAGEIGALVAAVGSGGSLCGVGRVLKRLVPGIRVVAVDAVGSVLFHQPDRKRLQSGHGNSVIPGNLDHAVVDEVHWLADGEAFNGCRELAAQTGMFAGGSSGAVYVVASWTARQLPETTNVVALLPDRGDRYHQTVYSDEYLQRHALAGERAGDEPLPIRYGRDEARRWSYSQVPHDGSVPFHAAGVQRTAELARAIGLAGEPVK